MTGRSHDMWIGTAGGNAVLSMLNRQLHFMQTMKKYITSRHRRLEQSPLNRFQLLRLIKQNGRKKKLQRRQVDLVELINYVPISRSLLGVNRSPDCT